MLARARLEGDELVLSWPGHEEFTKRIGNTMGSTDRTESTGGTA